MALFFHSLEDCSFFSFGGVRLQEISEELRSRCPQRKRSSSLPVPKIEVSLCSETQKSKGDSKGDFKGEAGPVAVADNSSPASGKFPFFKTHLSLT